jgi:hypothetical protein
MESYFKNSASPREIELLANLDVVLKKLAEASVLLHETGKHPEAVRDYQSAVHVEHYLTQHEIVVGDVWRGVDYSSDFFQK